MTQIPDPPRSDVDNLDDDLVVERGLDDGVFDSLLSDAFDAPPVPQSLSRRLEDGIAERWGHSPGLVEATAVERGASGLTRFGQWGSKKLRTWQGAAATIAAVLLVAVLLDQSAHSAWAALCEALERGGVMEVADGPNVRWLDLPNQMIGRETDSETVIFDGRKRLLLTRAASSNIVEQSTLGKDRTPSSDGLVVAFFRNEPLTQQSLGRLSRLSVVTEQSRKIVANGRELTNVEVRFCQPDHSEFSIRCQVDPASNLPVSVEQDSVEQDSFGQEVVQRVDEPRRDRVMIALAKSSVDGLKRQEQMLAERVAKLDRPAIQQSVTPLDEAPNTTPSDAELAQATVGSQTTAATLATLPIGSANAWAAVDVVSRSDDAVVGRVNELLGSVWAENNVTPAEHASDVQLLRRAYLDLAGRTPTVTEVRAFLSDTDDQRYERLIDQLLESPDHSSQLAAVWRSFLIPDGVNLDTFGGRAAFDKWLAGEFASGAPYDQVVRKLLLAEGRLSRSGPLLFYTALKLDADQIAARTSRAFLGIRLECAQCHDHPFEPWKQQDFWGYAAFFAQISRPRGELENASAVMRVQDVNRGEVMMPDTDIAIPPKFLGVAAEVSLQQGQAVDDAAAGPGFRRGVVKETAPSRRESLADWITSDQNPYFARATVNRLWAYLFGRGIVEPVDDFGLANPPVSAELMDTLAGQLIDSGYDLKRVIRTIVLSDAYRLSSGDADVADDAAERRLKLFAQMNVKTLTAEQLYDCIAVATLLDAPSNQPTMGFTLERFSNTGREAFLQQFAAPASNRAEYLAGIPQALTLMNGGLINGATSDQNSGMIRSLQAPFFTDRQRIDVLFMATLSRPATDSEQELLADLIPKDASDAQRYAALSDMLWALINSSEFALNH